MNAAALGALITAITALITAIAGHIRQTSHNRAARAARTPAPRPPFGGLPPTPPAAPKGM